MGVTCVCSCDGYDQELYSEFPGFGYWMDMIDLTVSTEILRIWWGLFCMPNHSIHRGDLTYRCGTGPGSRGAARKCPAVPQPSCCSRKCRGRRSESLGRPAVHCLSSLSPEWMEKMGKVWAIRMLRGSCPAAPISFGCGSSGVTSCLRSADLRLRDLRDLELRRRQPSGQGVRAQRSPGGNASVRGLPVRQLFAGLHIDGRELRVGDHRHLIIGHGANVRAGQGKRPDLLCSGVVQSDQLSRSGSDAIEDASATVALRVVPLAAVGGFMPPTQGARRQVVAHDARRGRILRNDALAVRRQHDRRTIGLPGPGHWARSVGQPEVGAPGDLVRNRSQNLSL